MKISWNDKYDPELIAQKIEETKKVDKNGKISFAGFEFLEYETLLFSMLRFPIEIPDREAQNIVKSAIRVSAKNGKITPKSMLAQASKLANSYLALPFTRYTLYTSISINSRWQSPISKVHFGNNIICFDKEPSKKFIKASSQILQQTEKSTIGGMPKDYTYVRVFVSAREIYEAADQAIDTIDFVRAVWNWQINMKTGLRYSTGSNPKRINKLILGPIHTLHYPNGQIASSATWWYEPNYVGPIETYRDKDEWKQLSEFLKKVKFRLSKHKYADIIENSLIRYTRALDERNLQSSFLRLWSVLELLTNTEKESYDVTIKRTAFLFEDTNYHRQVLLQLRDYRNATVHLDKEDKEIETHLYQLKGYVEAQLGFHLFNNFGFKTIQDAAIFLNSSTLKKDINHQIKMLSNVKHYRRYS